MINFKEIELNDKIWMEPLLSTADMSGCHQNFTNIFAWSKTYYYRVAQVNDYLVVKGILDNIPYYFYPAGSGDIMTVFELMQADAVACGHDFVLAGVSPENMAELKRMFPEHFEYKEMRESFDYVYLLDKLVTLAGNKLHSKRNYINRFNKENQNWSFEKISLENLAECWEMNLQWCQINSNHEDEIAKESCAVRRCFQHFTALGLEGGLIRAEGKVIAFTMGELLNSDTYVIHIEKAFAEIVGAYQMINREFAAFIQKNYPQQIYVNREEDMGLEGLRKAKLSYHPDKMEVKYLATYFEG
ncbi:MAG: phosphatidylglycerol lysyltransferase domain-containing protein [Desulfosporosinus sp.]|nr:phosphatidylglycerol lysyltransferase domain-containing protein [Desulfosporosinus sp.]